MNISPIRNNPKPLAFGMKFSETGKDCFEYYDARGILTQKMKNALILLLKKSQPSYEIDELNISSESRIKPKTSVGTLFIKDLSRNRRIPIQISKSNDLETILENLRLNY